MMDAGQHSVQAAISWGSTVENADRLDRSSALGRYQESKPDLLISTRSAAAVLLKGFDGPLSRAGFELSPAAQSGGYKTEWARGSVRAKKIAKTIGRPSNDGPRKGDHNPK